MKNTNSNAAAFQQNVRQARQIENRTRQTLRDDRARTYQSLEKLKQLAATGELIGKTLRSVKSTIACTSNKENRMSEKKEAVRTAIASLLATRAKTIRLKGELAAIKEMLTESTGAEPSEAVYVARIMLEKGVKEAVYKDVTYTASRKGELTESPVSDITLNLDD